MTLLRRTHLDRDSTIQRRVSGKVDLTDGLPFLDGESALATVNSSAAGETACDGHPFRYGGAD
jgi:hypothetical protein